ncbi:hypothetical protein KKH43_00935 [Patescibacteria group bacterium]|nr:hypothetical protein [Patescibacteria group bacterium]
MKEKKINAEKLDWDTVQAYLNEKTPAGSAMAVIETDKVLDALLEKLGYTGKKTTEKVRAASGVMDNVKELIIARRVTSKLKNDLNAEISEKEAEEVLRVYMDAIRSLTETEKHAHASLKNKVIARVEKSKGKFKKTMTRLIIGFFAFFLLVYILDSTQVGKKAVSGLVSVSHFLFSWILFTFLLVAGVLTIILSTFFYFEKRRKKVIASTESSFSSDNSNTK